MNSLQAELEVILSTLLNFRDPWAQLDETKQAILATVSKHLPEKRTAMMVTHCPYCSRNFPTVEEEYNTAITEMEKTLGADHE